MIKAIIFDCFGVLTTDGWLPFKAKYFGHDPHLMERAGELNRQVDAGAISYHHFIDKISGLANIPPATARLQIEDHVLDPELFQYIRDQLKPHYKIGMLSNSGGNWLSSLFTPNQLAMFDATALSFEIGFIKPEPQAYQLIARRLNLPVEDCLFVDDQDRYCAGAAAIGMPAIHFQNLGQLRTALAELAILT